MTERRCTPKFRKYFGALWCTKVHQSNVRTQSLGQTTALVSVFTGPSTKPGALVTQKRWSCSTIQRPVSMYLYLYLYCICEHVAGSQCQTSAVSAGFAGDDPRISVHAVAALALAAAALAVAAAARRLGLHLG